MDAAEEVARLLTAAGGSGFPDALARFETLPDTACAALLAVVAGTVPRPPTGAPGAHPRDVVEDASETVHVAARRWPERFEAVVVATPALRRDTNVAHALRELDTPGSLAILVAAAQVREAGHGYLRATAVASLLARRSPALTDLLPRLLGDRHDAARQAAVDAAPRFADERALPALRRIADNPRRTPWERDRARRAITRIGGPATTS
ncbi:HEAT repeat domain-containing protein [Asanoa sp. WMMD1127]|uniref:HEAT repeat domain-containing protein n=1 Tax=Asanoa sp. WMMD1127 TaxID=3016107 RepID=UPI0024172F49|nr:HEAT repeat domain-containing protein [Asanoa sp. WMMD1127]MDG4826636.1 HEAT repeat domain-containing protein [Asanoa sp. WMMD1127]